MHNFKYLQGWCTSPFSPSSAEKHSFLCAKKKKKSKFPRKLKIHVENSKGERRGGAFLGPPPVQAHRQAAMTVPAPSEAESHLNQAVISRQIHFEL